MYSTHLIVPITFQSAYSDLVYDGSQGSATINLSDSRWLVQDQFDIVKKSLFYFLNYEYPLYAIQIQLFGRQCTVYPKADLDCYSIYSPY